MYKSIQDLEIYFYSYDHYEIFFLENLKNLIKKKMKLPIFIKVLIFINFYYYHS